VAHIESKVLDQPHPSRVAGLFPEREQRAELNQGTTPRLSLIPAVVSKPGHQAVEVRLHFLVQFTIEPTAESESAKAGDQ
jgi:hypothetical protein